MPSTARVKAGRSVVTVLVMTGILAGCGATSTTPSIPTPTDTPVPTAAPTAIPTPTAGPTASPRPVYGSPIPVGSEQTLTLIAAEEWPGTSAMTPGTGYILVTIKVKVDAVKATMVAATDFPLYDGFGHHYNPAAAGRTPQLAPIGPLAAGASAAGYLTYRIPKDVGLADLDLYYSPHFLDGSVDIRLVQ